MTRHLNTGLPFEDWPLQDRKLFEGAFEGVDLFASGPGSSLAPATKYGRKADYGLWLNFLSHIFPDALKLTPRDRVDQTRVEDYVEYLRENCRETTIAHCLGRLFYTIRAFCPDRDWQWLYRISKRIAVKAKPIKHRQVLSLDLYALGLRVMDRALVKANALGRLTKSCSVAYRDGLLIATLTEAPMRRGAFSRLQIDDHMMRVGQRWCLTVPAENTKTNTAQEYELSERLSSYMDFYLEQVRLEFPGADRHNSLWPYEGRPMTDKMIRRRTIKWTRLALGFEVTPHRFRNAAATFISVADPENIRVAKDLLGHRSFAMTEKHYIDRAQARIAGRKLAAILAERGQSAPDIEKLAAD
ncbi:site-specific integrase [Mesorhizobium sp.]|jgi:integrase|uniref:site-specific integrase n=3 Tax=Mesorhizobium sp. TaxID=1871066 RepID=UPI00122712E8|nr:site-specific integrase [Mesorhizobium sp.]TIM42965.1 MAG: site-specific integrase [Mesorhizobium sp.]